MVNKPPITLGVSERLVSPSRKAEVTSHINGHKKSHSAARGMAWGVSLLLLAGRSDTARFLGTLTRVLRHRIAGSVAAGLLRPGVLRQHPVLVFPLGFLFIERQLAGFQIKLLLLKQRFLLRLLLL